MTRLKEHKFCQQVRRSTPEQVDPWREYILQYFRVAVLLRIQKLSDWDAASLRKTSCMLHVSMFRRVLDLTKWLLYNCVPLKLLHFL